jgi:broad specificity phosphatase PhoE
MGVKFSGIYIQGGDRRGVLKMPAPFLLADLKIDAAALNNSYFALRHGHATSNLDGVLCGAEPHGCRYGLTPLGVQEVEDSAGTFIESQAARIREASGLLILSSPLSRALESAEIFAKALRRGGALQVELEVCDSLRERGYGTLEGAAVSAWAKLHHADLQDAYRAPYGAECAAAMFHRLHGLFCRIEQTHAGRVVVLVSHCDPIQVMQNFFESGARGHYSEVGELLNGAVVELGN